MKRVATGLMLALAAYAPVIAQTTLNLRDADVRAFIQDASRVTGRNFIIDGRVQGKVTVVSDRPLSRSEYFEVFLSTLRANASGLPLSMLSSAASRSRSRSTRSASRSRSSARSAAGRAAHAGKARAAAACASRRWPPERSQRREQQETEQHAHSMADRRPVTQPRIGYFLALALALDAFGLSPLR